MAGATIGQYGGPEPRDTAEFQECGLIDSTVTVRLSSRLLREIRASAVAGLISIRRGGLEVGGVLFGKSDGGDLVVLDHRPLSIEYLSGPSFTLSGTDEVNLQQLLEESVSDPALDGLRAVGWYHSHTRSDVSLSPEDIALHERHFPHPEQIAVVIRPFKFEPARVAIFRRTADLRLTPDSPSYRFELASSRKRATEIFNDDALAAGSHNSTERSAPASPDQLSEPVLRASPPRRPEGRVRSLPIGRKSGAIAAALMVFAVAGTVFMAKRPTHAEQAAPVRLQLSAAAGEQLNIAWDGDSQTVKAARGGSVTITDSGHQDLTIPLDRESLKRGNVTYVRKTGDVIVRIRIPRENGPALEEIARFIGPEPLPKASPSEKEEYAASELLRMRAELERAKTELSRIQPESQRTRQVPVPAENQRAAAPQPVAHPAVTLGKAATPPPQITVADAAPQLQLNKPSLPVVSLPVAPAPAPPPVQNKPVVKPASGRAIWTGRLSKGGLLLLDGRRPSAGSLSGRFPQQPARMKVHPADLEQSGIVIYTAAMPAHAVEPPSAANGWNLTTYSADPKRSRAITVVESPGQQNGWKPRLLIRAEDKTVSMLVIDWEELPSAQGQ
jgi:proteasome lid subunit RPN8/RPN11